jgi:hypothetical protein
MALVLDLLALVCQPPASMSGTQIQLSLPPPSASGPLTSIQKKVVGLAPRLWFLAFALAAAPLILQTASAGVVTWDVDRTNSYIRLTIPDQSLAVTNLGNVTLRMRDASSTSQWTDAGGRRAPLDGRVATDYLDGTSITFLSGSHDLYAIDTTSLRPNPAEWNAATSNYTGTSTAPAALGGRVRGTYTILTFDAAFLAFRSVQLDITNTVTGPIVITDGTFAANSTRCGITSALVDVDGLELPLGLGQPIPDVLHGQLHPIVQQNAAGGTISNLGGLNRKLTYTISIPNLSIDLNGMVVAGSAAGLIVAYAVIPAPPLPPTLSARRQGASLVLAWPTNTTGFLLKYATNLPTTNWMPATPLPVIANGENVVTNAFTGGPVFYRLQKP